MESTSQTAKGSTPAPVVAAENHDSIPCEECGEAAALYLCPRCSFRSCSLACCKAHKSRLDCNGKRDRTAYTRSMTDDTLRSDYHFLEEVLGTVDSSKRLSRQFGLGTGNSPPPKLRKVRHPGADVAVDDQDVPPPRSQHTLLSLGASGTSSCALTTGVAPQINHPKWRHFQNHLASKGIQVLYMPLGMERRKSNRSYVKNNSVYWTVEWMIYNDDSESQPEIHVTQAVSEHTPLDDFLAKLDLTVVSSSRSLLLKRIPCPSNHPVFVDLCSCTTLSAALKDLTVLEYPTIYSVPLSRLSEFPRLITEVASAKPIE